MKTRLRELRAERGWSQADLAAEPAVSRPTVSALERGTYDPSLPLAFRIARTFGRAIEEGFDDEAAGRPARRRASAVRYATEPTRGAGVASGPGGRAWSIADWAAQA